MQNWLLIYAHFIKDYELSSKFPKTKTLILKCALLRTSQRYMYYMWNMRNYFMYIHLLSSREKGIKLLTIKRVSAFTTLNLSRGHLKSRWKTIVPNSAQCYCSLPKTRTWQITYWIFKKFIKAIKRNKLPSLSPTVINNVDLLYHLRLTRYGHCLYDWGGGF